MEVFAIQNSEKSCLKALAFRHKATPCFKGNLKLIRIACMHVLVISIKYSEKKKKKSILPRPAQNIFQNL